MHGEQKNHVSVHVRLEASSQNACLQNLKCENVKSEFNPNPSSLGFSNIYLFSSVSFNVILFSFRNFQKPPTSSFIMQQQVSV